MLHPFFDVRDPAWYGLGISISKLAHRILLFAFAKRPIGRKAVRTSWWKETGSTDSYNAPK
jgi:hypothetical protein